ncbi:uncharacterized protein OCT59_019523 [Rhizophagus irregularis]|uniref:uncharacterized protein n=1 Tax=Rhizophagus irregularis TaxID=588596 RepID=UPI00332DBD3D|nr:hypothetical protein OCT59_019523 [Rhizophagus irregularis]
MDIGLLNCKGKYFRWDDDAVKLLLLFLIVRKDAVRHLGSNRGNIKPKLWSEASDVLLNSGHHYSPRQCSVKWNNIKAKFKDDMVKSCNNPIQVRYKTEIEEILGRSHYYSGINKYRRWDDGAIKLLFLFLIDRKDAVRLLSTNRGNIKPKLWSEASDVLLNSGHHYSPRQCSVKWNNIKAKFKVQHGLIILIFIFFLIKKYFVRMIWSNLVIIQFKYDIKQK